MATKQEYNKKVKQLAVLHAAEETFLKKAYRSITMNEIAKLAGVTKRTIYSYYPSKLALFIQMFEDYLQKLHNKILDVAGKNLPPDEKLVLMADVVFTFTVENEAFMRLFWTLDSHEFDGEIPPELAKSIHLWNRDMIETAVKITRKGQEQGLIAFCDPELLIHVISAFIKGTIFHTNKEAKLSIARVDPEQMQNLFMRLVSRGLSPHYAVDGPGHNREELIDANDNG